jgi:putative cell wall-binding protein
MHPAPQRRRARRLPAAILALLGLALAGPAAASATGASPPTATARHIVRMSEGADAGLQAQTIAGVAAGVQVERVYHEVFDGFAAALTQDQAERLRSDPRVLAVEEETPVVLHREPVTARSATTQRNPPWGLDRIDQRQLPLSGTYTPSTTGAGVTAYVVDSGVRATHVELTGRVGAGFSAIDDGRGSADCDGHGTHVAGTLGGTTFGVAKSVAVEPVRVLDCQGSGSSVDLIAGLDWIVKHHAAGAPAVANLSLGGPVSSAVDAAVRAVIADGVTVVASSGNAGQLACDSSPARVPTAVTVGATDRTDTAPTWSNHGSCLDLFAPGVGVVSASHLSTTGAVGMSGTSMAAPHVAGVAAMLLAAEPDLSPSLVAARLVEGATSGLVADARIGSPNRLLHSSVSAAVPALRTSRRLAATSDAVHAAIDLSRGSFSAGEARHVLLGRDDVFADSLAGAALAGTDGPILYTPGGAQAPLSSATRAELQRVLGPGAGCGSGRMVYILGGDQAVSLAAEQEVRTAGYCVQRYAGASRVETSVAIATDVIARTGARQVLLARSDSWADAATGGAYAAATGAPVVVTQTAALHRATDGFLQRVRPADIVVLGGPAAVSVEAAAQAGRWGEVRRVAGASRDMTAVEIGRRLWPAVQPRPTGVVLVNGYAANGWVYALAAAVPAAREGAVQLYVQADQLSAGTQVHLDGVDYRFAVAAGPASLISDRLHQQVRDGTTP